MWQRFTERARKVIFYAQEEAQRLGESQVSTEHLLLGLVRESDSVAARILDRMGVSLQRIRNEIERYATRSDARSDAVIRPYSGFTSLYITPGYQWQAVDAMITNFHLPRSTLLAMIGAFMGMDFMRRTYALAIRERYRFYSFGDAMLII